MGGRVKPSSSVKHLSPLGYSSDAAVTDNAESINVTVYFQNIFVCANLWRRMHNIHNYKCSIHCAKQRQSSIYARVRK